MDQRRNLARPNRDGKLADGPGNAQRPATVAGRIDCDELAPTIPRDTSYSPRCSFTARDALPAVLLRSERRVSYLQTGSSSTLIVAGRFSRLKRPIVPTRQDPGRGTGGSMGNHGTSIEAAKLLGVISCHTELLGGIAFTEEE